MKRAVVAAVCFALILVLIPVAATASPRSSADDIPRSLRKQLEAVVKEKIASLLKEKDDKGRSYQTGRYSRNFQKVGDDAYQVSFVHSRVDGDQMIDDRYLLTLEKNDATGKWEIAKEDLKDTFDQRFRNGPGNEKYFKFASFDFDFEGLKLSASNGSLATDYHKDGLRIMRVQSDSISYSYAPPPNAPPNAHHKHQVIMARDEYRESIQFVPESFSISCEPVKCQEIFDASFKGLQEVALSQLHAELAKEEKERVEQQEEFMEERPFWGFSLPLDPDLRTFSISLKEKGKNQYAYLSYNNMGGYEITFGATQRFGPYAIPSTYYGYYTQETLDKHTEYELERRDDPSRRDYDVIGVSGTISLAVDDRDRGLDSEDMTGDLTYFMRAKRDLDHVDFFIARGQQLRTAEKEEKDPLLSVNSIENGKGEEFTWVKTGPVTGRVILPERVPKDSTFVIRMSFENRGIIYDLSGSYSYLSRGGWLPFVAFGDMIHYMDMKIRVPAGFKTLGIGTKLDEWTEDDGDVNVTHWVAKNPVEFPTVIWGKYHERTAEAVATKLDGSKIDVVAHLDKDTVSLLNLPLKGMKTFAEQAAISLELYKDVFGVDYPYGKLDVVNDASTALYGQSPSSIVYIGGAAWYGKASLESSGGGTVSKFLNSLMAHEVGHQWWGSRVANANSRNYWFVESLAEFSSAIFVEVTAGPKAYQEHVESWRDEILRSDLIESVQGSTSLFPGQYGGGRASIYAKGPFVFHMLRSWMRIKFGSDEPFQGFLKHMAQSLKGQEIVTRDMQTMIENYFSTDEERVLMETFFDNWLRGIGRPLFEFGYNVRPTEDGQYLIEGVVRQKIVAGKEKTPIEGLYYDALTRISVDIGGGKEGQFPIVISGPETTFRQKVKTKPKRVYLNKYHDVLAEDVKLIDYPG